MTNYLSIRKQNANVVSIMSFSDECDRFTDARFYRGNQSSLLSTI